MKEEIDGCPSKDQKFDPRFHRCLNIADTCNNETEFYNEEEHRCEKVPVCSAGFFFSREEKKCVLIDYITSPETENLIYPNRPFSEYEQEYQDQLDSDPHLKDCPTSHPYY